MVDVGGKSDTARLARAAGSIFMEATTLDLIRCGSAKKGDVLGIARVAAIMASKRTGELIPSATPSPSPGSLPNLPSIASRARSIAKSPQSAMAAPASRWKH